MAVRESAARSESTRLRLALVGWGAIARATARLLRDRCAPVQIVAVATRESIRPRPDVPPDARLLTSPRDLAQSEAQVVIEAASRQAVAPWGRAALEAGLDFVVTSVSAFADAEVLKPIDGNPKSSAMTALNLVRCVENRLNPLVI